MRAYGRKALARFPRIRDGKREDGSTLIPEDIQDVIVCPMADDFLRQTPTTFSVGNVENVTSQEELFLLDEEGNIVVQVEGRKVMLEEGKSPRIIIEGESVRYTLLRLVDPDQIRYGILVVRGPKERSVTITKPPKTRNWISRKLRNLGARKRGKELS